MSKHHFFNLHLSSYLLTSLGVVFVTFVGVLVLHFPVWLLYAVIALLIIYIFAHSGNVKINRSGNDVLIDVKKLNQQLTIQTPVQAMRWWNYAHTEGPSQDRKGISTQVRSMANRYHVYLKLTDLNGQVICFHELIVFDGRFPNEVDYNITLPKTDWKMVKVQRTDQLYDYLHSRLESLELTETIAPPSE